MEGLDLLPPAWLATKNPLASPDGMMWEQVKKPSEKNNSCGHRYKSHLPTEVADLANIDPMCPQQPFSVCRSLL